VGLLPVDPAWQYRLSVDDYHRLIDSAFFGEDSRVELLEGVLVAMIPQGRRHARMISFLSKVFFSHASASQLVRVQLPLTLARSEPEPDLAVVDLEAEELSRRHPESALLVVEIAGEESLRKDRQLKMQLYAEATVGEYWIVEVERAAIAVFRNPDPTMRSYRDSFVAKPPDTLRPLAQGAADVDLALLFNL
jgi:Uma2 family endonuclease